MVLLTEIAEDSFVMVTHFTENTSKMMSFVLSALLLNGLTVGFAWVGDHFIKAYMSKKSCEIIAVSAFFFYALYNIIRFFWHKDASPKKIDWSALNERKQTKSPDRKDQDDLENVSVYSQNFR